MYFELEKNKFAYRAVRDEKLGKTPHLHSQIELILVNEGESIGFADDKSEVISAGDLFIVFPNQVHYYHGNAVHGRVIVSPEICPELSRIFKKFVPKTPVLKGVNALIKTSVENIIDCKTDEFTDTEIRGNLLILFSEIFRNVELQENLQCETNTVKNMINYCYENYASDISVDSIAAHLHVSKYYVSRLFGGRLHMSFNDYINSLRIMRACECLKQSDCTVSDIAYNVGYNSIRTFNRVFLNIKGVTPREYRKSHTGE